MKKNAIFFSGCWAFLVAVFNVICFVIPSKAFGITHFDATFWIGWAFVMLAFSGHLATSLIICKEKNAGKLFYKIPLLNVAYGMLIVNIAVGAVLMVIPAIPSWVAIIVCLLIFAFNVVAVMKSVIAKNVVEEIEENVKAKTLTIRTLTLDAESIMNRASTDAIKAECRKVYEAIRYSDPMSAPELLEIESSVSANVKVLAAAVDANNEDAVADVAKKIVLLVEERNAKCKLYK